MLKADREGHRPLACEPCSRDDCGNCRVMGCVCCGDAQEEHETCCSVGACDYDMFDDDYWEDDGRPW